LVGSIFFIFSFVKLVNSTLEFGTKRKENEYDNENEIIRINIGETKKKKRLSITRSRSSSSSSTVSGLRSSSTKKSIENSGNANDNVNDNANDGDNDNDNDTESGNTIASTYTKSEIDNDDNTIISTQSLKFTDESQTILAPVYIHGNGNGIGNGGIALHWPKIQNYLNNNCSKNNIIMYNRIFPPICQYTVETVLIALTICGATSGFLGGLIGTSSPPQLIAFSMLDLSKGSIRGKC
jgi:hypothetical protein